jgi:hypothetical protein
MNTQRTRGAFTNIITDAYSTAGDVLTVERQLSVLAQPPAISSRSQKNATIGRR